MSEDEEERDNRGAWRLNGEGGDDKGSGKTGVATDEPGMREEDGNAPRQRFVEAGATSVRSPGVGRGPEEPNPR